MKLIKPSFEILEQEAGLEGMYKQIEKVGRTCYKSEDKIAEGTAKPFVDRMVASKHLAMCEHGTVYLSIPIRLGTQPTIERYLNNCYSRVAKSCVDNHHYYCVTTNLRVIIENEWMDDLCYLCEPTEHHVKRITVKFTCDRGVSHEFVRHRVFSFAQESTRYCNYSKDKFGNELTFIIPEWCPEIREDSNKGWDTCKMYDKLYLQHLQNAEDTYFALLKQWDERVPDKRYKSGFRNNPWVPQQARAVLPNSLKTELVMTGFVDDWSHFLDLRARGTTGAPHPQAKELAEPLMQEFIVRKYINN